MDFRLKIILLNNFFNVYVSIKWIYLLLNLKINLKLKIQDIQLIFISAQRQLALGDNLLSSMPIEYKLNSYFDFEDKYSWILKPDSQSSAMLLCLLLKVGKS